MVATTSKVILPYNVPISEKDGRPSTFFVRMLQQLLAEKADVATAANAAQTTADAAIPKTDLFAQLLLALGGDPAADKLLYWDDTSNTFKFLGIGTGLTISAGSLNSSGGGSSSGSSPRASLGAKGAATSGNTAAAYQTTILAETGLVAYYPMNDAAGSTTVADHKGTNTANVTTPFAFGMTGRIGSTCAYAPYGAAGAATRGCCRTTTRFIQDDFSVELWMLVTDLHMNGSATNTSTVWYGGAMLWGQDAAGVTNDFGASIGAFGDIYAGTGNPDVSIVHASSKNIVDGNWHHIVFTRTKATGALVLYIDGASVATGTGGVQSLTTLTNLQFASGPGFVADYAFYSTPLTAAKVLAHYTAGKP